jgi:hypothetical protein
MAKKKESAREYSLSDGALIEKTDSIISFATRDTAELTPEGVTLARLDALKDKRDDFNEMEDDEEWEGLVSEKVEEKNIAAALCETTVHNIRRMAANVFGEGKPKYKRFGFEGINRLEEDKKPKAYYRVWRRATAALADLTDEGLTALKLSDFKTAIDDFDVKLDVVDDTIADRDAATEERIELGNEIYTELVKVSNTGKDYWFDKSEAKYNDYVIYPTSTGNNYEIFEGEILSPGIVNIDTGDTVITSATTIKQKMTGTGGRGYFSEVPGTPAGPGQPFMDVENGQEATGEAGPDLGYQEGTRVILSVQNIGMTPGTYKFWVYIS